MSSTRLMETVDIANGSPAFDAARARARSPSRQERPFSPVGPTTAGSADGAPRSRAETARFETSTSVRGRKRSRANASRLPASARSSSAPPSTYAKTKRGSRRFAMARRSSMLMASSKRIAVLGMLARDASREYAAAEEGPLEPALAVHPAAPEPGGFARRVEPLDHAAILADDPAPEVGRDAAQALAADDELAYRQQGACAPVADRLERAGADPVAGPAAERCDAPQLLVVVEARPPADRGVVAGDRVLDGGEVHGAVAGERVHALDELRER